MACITPDILEKQARGFVPGSRLDYLQLRLDRGRPLCRQPGCQLGAAREQAIDTAALRRGNELQCRRLTKLSLARECERLSDRHLRRLGVAEPYRSAAGSIEDDALIVFTDRPALPDQVAQHPQRRAVADRRRQVHAAQPESLESTLAFVDPLDRGVEDYLHLGAAHRGQFFNEGVEVLLVAERQARAEPAVARPITWGTCAPVLHRQRWHPAPSPFLLLGALGPNAIPRAKDNPAFTPMGCHHATSPPAAPMPVRPNPPGRGGWDFDSGPHRLGFHDSACLRDPAQLPESWKWISLPRVYAQS
jgi:hypothetical protein